MLKWQSLLIVFCIGFASTALAQSDVPKAEEMGTKEQRAACHHDVGKFCKSVKPADGPFAYLTCLQANREKLRPACLKVIEGGGQ
jgi:hypothetical protein